MSNIESQIKELEFKLADLKNAKSEMDRVFSELSDKDLKDAVVEFSTFTYTPHITKLSGWPEFLIEKLCWILGKEVDSNVLYMARLYTYQEAAKRFIEKMK